MNNPNIITLDLTGCKYLGELHLKIKEAFDFPDYYGENWDAFWDLLNEPRDYTIVVVKGLNELPKDLQSSRDMIIKLLHKNKTDMDNFMKECPQFDYRFEYRIID